MPTTNGHGPKRAVLYARVSTQEQAAKGYSLAQQLEALRSYAAREGYEVIEEVEDRDLLLIRPRPAELPLRSGEDATRLGVHEQLRHVALGQLPRILVHNAHDLLRFAAYRELPRPRERRAAGLTGLEVWSAVDVHLCFAEIS